MTGGLVAAERRGLSVPGRLLLVGLGELGLAADIWIGRADEVHAFAWLALLPVMVVLGLLVTVQAHHRFPVAWHVVVFFGWAASLMVAPWAATWGHDPAALTTFEGAYVAALGWFAVIAIEVSCLLALVRPAGTSYLTWNKIRQADGG